MEKALRVYRFIQPNGGHFKVAVFARFESQAREKINREALSCVSYRSLEFAGEGYPADPENWLACKAE